MGVWRGTQLVQWSSRPGDAHHASRKAAPGTQPQGNSPDPAASASSAGVRSGQRSAVTAPMHFSEASPLHPALPAVSDVLPGTPDTVGDEGRGAIERQVSAPPPAFVPLSPAARRIRRERHHVTPQAQLDQTNSVRIVDMYGTRRNSESALNENRTASLRRNPPRWNPPTQGESECPEGSNGVPWRWLRPPSPRRFSRSGPPPTRTRPSRRRSH
jgi:hypothetical protein